MNRYNEYLKNLKSFPKDFGEVGFMKVKDINIPSCVDDIINANSDPFVSSVHWEEFKTDLLDRGTFWKIVIFNMEITDSGMNSFKKPDGNWWLYEGYHRIKAWNEMIDGGILPINFKVLVIRFKTDANLDPRSNYYGELVECVTAYRFLNVSRLIPHKEINEIGYWGELK